MTKYRWALLFLLCFVTLSGAEEEAAPSLPLRNIKLPGGFAIGIFARDVPGARSMALGEKGVLFVGTRDEKGKVYAVVSSDGKKADEVIVVAEGLLMPNGIAFRDGALFVTEVNRILRYDRIEDNLKAVPQPVVVSEALPRNPHHGWRYTAFGPDGKLYIGVGAPCNVCESEDRRFATIMRMNQDGSGLEVYASGIRNTVGFDWNPSTGELWFTDNGRDWMGDNQPPDELNRAPEQGLHFGFPYCHGKNILDPQFGKNRTCDEFAAPEIELGPHVASLGMRFYTGTMFPKEYRGQIFIAEHGSWNRTTPIGYRITLVQFSGNRADRYTVFAEGWLSGGTAWGRPVDVEVMPDGALLVSDDKAGVIYRIHYRGK